MQKVLIITYYWPPAGGPGVQRWLNFVKYLRDFEIEPIVFIPKNAHYPLKDDSLLSEVPEGIQIINQPIFEPYGIASILSGRKTKRISSGIISDYKKQSFLERLLLWIRGNLFIPDARKYWVKPSVKKLADLIRKEQITNIITTGPPHSVHLIGKKLKEQLGVHWIADFRDPWTTIGYHKKLKLSNSSKRKHKSLEKAVLTTADDLIVTSNTTKDEFEKLTSTPIKVITNGYDGNVEASTPDLKFSLAHIGSLLTGRNPENLWKALSSLLEENEALRSSLEIRLIGAVGDGVIESLNKYGLEEYTEIIGYVSHEAVLDYQTSAQLLLLLEIDSEDTKGIIPGKLFEYFKARRPIVAIGPKNWEAGEMVENQHAGHYLVHGDATGIKELLLKRFEAFQAGKLDCESKGIEQYHRRNLTEKLANLLTWESS